MAVQTNLKSEKEHLDSLSEAARLVFSTASSPEETNIIKEDILCQVAACVAEARKRIAQNN